MSALPPIPDEAVAAVSALPPGWHTCYGSECGQCSRNERAEIEAAWPHLYAAALRHAADDPTGDPVLQRLTRSWLRRLADEAEKIGGGVSEESP